MLIHSIFSAQFSKFLVDIHLIVLHIHQQTSFAMFGWQCKRFVRSSIIWFNVITQDHFKIVKILTCIVHYIDLFIKKLKNSTFNSILETALIRKVFNILRRLLNVSIQINLNVCMKKSTFPIIFVSKHRLLSIWTNFFFDLIFISVLVLSSGLDMKHSQTPSF